MERASDLLREARQRAGLTQAALAEQVGVTQSVVSAYESGRRDPSLTTLQRLLAAAGHRLQLVAAAPDPSLAGPQGARVRRHRAALRDVAGEHGARLLGVFGSVARGEDTEESDVDLLVDLPDGAGFLALFRLQEALEAELGVGVDVVVRDGLTDAVRQAAERDLVPL